MQDKHKEWANEDFSQEKKGIVPRVCFLHSARFPSTSRLQSGGGWRDKEKKQNRKFSTSLVAPPKSKLFIFVTSLLLSIQLMSLLLRSSHACTTSKRLLFGCFSIV